MKLKAICLTLIVLIATGCGPGPSLRDQDAFPSADAVMRKSLYFKVPVNASNIRYKAYDFLDRNEYIYFRSDRSSIDEFARDLLGFIPFDTDYRLERGMAASDEPWWPTQTVTNSRGGKGDNDGKGMREVLIVDRAGYSEVWAFKSSA